jgi:heat shock protein HtpX
LYDVSILRLKIRLALSRQLNSELSAPMTERTTVSPRRPGAIAASYVVITALVAMVLGSLIGRALLGVVLGVALAVFGIIWAYTSANSLLLRVSRAKTATEQQQPRLHNLVHGVCMTAGVQPPEIYVIDDLAPNALVVAVSPQKSALAVTTGMLMDCDRVELEGVVAHLVSRLRSGQAIAGTLTAVLIGAPLLLSQLGLRAKWWNGGRNGHPQDPQTERSLGASILAGCGAVAAALLSPLLSPLLRLFVPTELIRQADLAACQLTRYPPAIISVLDRGAGVVSPGPSSVTHSGLGVTNHLWMLPAIGGLDGEVPISRYHRYFRAHPPTSDRISSLKEL